MRGMSETDPAPEPPPIPVQSLAYSLPQQGRPGIITAIAVLCIVVACLSALFSFGIGMYGFMFYMMSKVSSSMTTMSTPASVSAPAPPPAVQALQPGEAGTADNTLQSMLSLDAARVRELDKLMRAHGRQVFGIDEDTTLTAATIRESVKEPKPAEAGSNSPASFKTEEGTVEIYPDRALFTSADSSTTVTTSSAKNSDDQSQSVAAAGTDPTTNPATQPADTTLPPAEVERVIAKVRQMGRISGLTLSPSQVRAVRTALSVPSQDLVTPGTPSPVMSVSGARNSYVFIQFDGGSLQLGPQGQVISSMSTRATMRGFPGFNVTGAAAGTVIGEAIASIGLAIYLFVVGILAFRSSPKNPWLLRIYACVKIVLALLAGSGIAWMAYQFASGVTQAGATATGTAAAPPSWRPFITAGCVIAALGLLFPIGLLIALRIRTVNEYYSTPTVN